MYTVIPRFYLAEEYRNTKWNISLEKEFEFGRNVSVNVHVKNGYNYSRGVKAEGICNY